jgi:DNA-binding CsgD family transcriptional regulator
MATELLERTSHLAQLEEHLRQAADGHGRVVLVGGEAGVGKTTLANAFCRRVTGATVLRTSCDALATPGPLAPLRDLGPALGLPPDQPVRDGEAREQLFRGVLAALSARPEPTVIVGEDAHWADGPTLELLRFVSRRIEGLRLLYVVTYRDDEIGPHHPLRLILGDLASSPTVYRLKLRPLSPAAVDRMVAGSGRDATELYRLTGGNPFFLTEVLAAGDGAVPATVGDAVLARAARLSPEARAMLDVAAVIGTSVDADLLLAVVGPALDETDECIAGGLLLPSETGLAFRHALARDAVLATISPPRRRLLHARVLAALRQQPATAHDLARLVHHAEAAGDREAVLTLATAAAEQAVALHGHREAAAHYGRALRVGDHLPAAERARLLEGRSVACYLCDQAQEAITARLAALDLWRRLGNPQKEGENLRWLSRLYWFNGQGPEAEEAATAALEVLEALPPGPELAMAYSTLAQLRMLADDQAGALFWGERAIAMAQERGETETLIHALTNVGTARLHLENSQGREEVERSLQLALEHGFADHAMRAMTNLAWDATRFRRHAEAERRLTTAIAFATDHDLDNYRGYLVATRAVALANRGAWDEAEAEVQALLRLPSVLPLARALALTALGLVGTRRGDPAAAALDEALALAEGTGQLLRHGPVRAARAEAALLAGDSGRARAEVDAVRDLVFTRGNQWQRGEFTWLLWQAGEREAAADDLAPPYALLIAGDFAAAGASWQALGCPYEAAAALAMSDDPALIRQAVDTFETLGATPALTLAIRRLRALGASDLPALRRGPRASTQANPAGLTRRQAEVLALVAAGFHNAEIGDQLFLSPKTVSHHISAIYAKLGVETRADAARIATQLGIVAP